MNSPRVARWGLVRRAALCLFVLPVLICLCPAGLDAQERAASPWAGDWYSYWAGGQALLSLTEADGGIEGVYRPGNGRIVGTAEGLTLRGTWTQAGATGAFEFALSPGGDSFVGRFGTGAYWNGERLVGAMHFEAVAGSGSPRAVLASVLETMAAAAGGNGAAELALRRYLVFPDNEPDLRLRNERIARLTRLISISTFRLAEVPEMSAEDRVTVEIGPDGTRWEFPVHLRRGFMDLWDVEVPPLGELEAYEEALLKAFDLTSFDAYNPGPSPRQVVRDFLDGTTRWRDGGRDRALAVLDLGEIPEALRAIDGPLAAEYLRQTLDRVGHPVFQEVPAFARREAPVELYANPGGRIEIVRLAPAGADGPESEAARPVWAFSSETLRAAPDIYAAVQNLPVAPGVEPVGTLTRAFWLRDRLRVISPWLLERTLALENWQWLAIFLCIPVATLGSALIVRLVWGAVRAGLHLGRAAPATHENMRGAFGWPARIYAGGLIVLVLVRELGLRQEASAVGNALAGLFTIVGGTVFVFRMVNAVTGSLARAASRTKTSYDDIAVAVGGGVAKIGVLVAGIVLAAELVGLPYEGVVATLGVGGLALGFAARDAVSNFISAGILLTDRPFKKGDLVEANGQLGIVEEVGLRSTRLRTLEDTMVIIPNAKISEEQVNNWGKLRHRRICLHLHVALETPRARLESFVAGIRQAFRSHPKAVPGELVSIHDITPAGVTILVMGYFETPDLADFAEARHGFVGGLVDLAERHGISFSEGEADSDVVFPEFMRG